MPGKPPLFKDIANIKAQLADHDRRIVKLEDFRRGMAQDMAELIRLQLRADERLMMLTGEDLDDDDR